MQKPGLQFVFVSLCLAFWIFLELFVFRFDVGTTRLLTAIVAASVWFIYGVLHPDRRTAILKQAILTTFGAIYLMLTVTLVLSAIHTHKPVYIFSAAATLVLGLILAVLWSRRYERDSEREFDADNANRSSQP